MSHQGFPKKVCVFKKNNMFYFARDTLRYCALRMIKEIKSLKN